MLTVVATTKPSHKWNHDSVTSRAHRWAPLCPFSPLQWVCNIRQSVDGRGTEVLPTINGTMRMYTICLNHHPTNPPQLVCVLAAETKVCGFLCVLRSHLCPCICVRVCVYVCVCVSVCVWVYGRKYSRVPCQKALEQYHPYERTRGDIIIAVSLTIRQYYIHSS